MTDEATILLDKVVIHLLDPKAAEGIVFSEAELPLQRESDVAQHLIGYIKSALDDQINVAAKFAPTTAPGATSVVCSDLLDGKVDFVAGSSMLATNLQKILKDDDRISKGNLLVCFFRLSDKPEIPRLLGVFKIDRTQVLRPRIDTVGGKRLVNFEVDARVLPSRDARLQKCAIVYPQSARTDFDFILLDRQTEPAAKFFTEGFLGATTAFTPETRARKFYLSVESVVNAMTTELTSDDKLYIHAYLVDALNGTRINIDSWVDSLALTDDTFRERIRVSLTKKMSPELEFEIDPAFARTALLQKQRFVGDHDLYVEVRRDFSEQMIHEEPSDRVGLRRIVIYTETWDEVFRKP